jgi:hypothetical protein
MHWADAYSGLCSGFHKGGCPVLKVIIYDARSIFSYYGLLKLAFSWELWLFVMLESISFSY